MMNPLIIGPDEQRGLSLLRDMANANPVDMVKLVENIKLPWGKAAHKTQMTKQTIILPTSYLVTFSIELNHPVGTARHLSVSTRRAGRVPNPAAVWMIAQQLGFTGDLDSCMHWVEELEGHGQAVNVVQPLICDAQVRQ